MGQYYFARWRLLPVVCRRRLSGSVTLTAGGRTAAGRVGGRAADTLQCAVRATSCFYGHFTSLVGELPCGNSVGRINEVTLR